jgi:putative salt-induced outer membrane protein YdiY
MKKTITTIVAAAGIMVAFAETSTNTSATAGVTPEKKYPWENSVSVGLTLTRGNSQTLLFTADFLTQKKTPDDEFMFGLGGAYGNQNSTETVNNYKAFGQWNHFFTERLYGYVRSEALRDHVASLDYRLTLGPGLGYYLLKDQHTFLATEAGAGFEVERLGGRDDSFATLRLAERFEHKFNDHARLWQTVELLPQADKFENYVVNFEIGLEAALTRTFSLKTYLDDTYQNRPAAAHLKNDVKIVAAVSYKF